MSRRSRLRTTNSHDKVPIRSYELQHREAALLELIKSYPNQILRGLAEQPEAGWYFGRLHIVGVIDKDQYSAARYLDRVTREYESMLRQYGKVQASSFIKQDYSSSEDLSQSAQKKLARAKRRYNEVYDLLNQCGINVRRSVVSALRQDEGDNLENIIRGLTVIATGLSSHGRRN